MQKDPETFAIIGAAMEVHRELGRGFLELVYQTALALEFQERAIPFKAEVALPIRYKNKLLTCAYRADFVCFESVIVETKAISALTGADEAPAYQRIKGDRSGARSPFQFRSDQPRAQASRLQPFRQSV
jgi:GxxExxY protein